MDPKHYPTFSGDPGVNRNQFSSSGFSEAGNAKIPDVGDVPMRLFELQYLAQQIQQRTSDSEIIGLARQIEEGINPIITAMAAAAEQLAEVA